MSSVWTRPNAGNVSRTPAVEGGEYADQAANPGHADGAAFVRQLIGDGAKVEATGRSIEYWSGDSMSDTGLAYNISGRATVIEAGVGERLAGFQDPIKAIFGTSICHDKTVIVKRKYVVGGAATITPERAPARTVQVREDVQSVELQRYGGDVTMNTNLFLRPADAEAEMTMKLDAQKKQLENKLVELGYNEIFDKALRLPDVAVRANPTFSNSGGVDVDSPEARAYARTVYFRSCFGAFAKHEFPLANLLASCKTSGAYTSADGPGTVLVIPHGSSEMLRYTKSSSMDYSISGLRTADQKPVTMAIENVAQDPSSGVKIMVHVPPTSYARSAALPSTDKGMLSEDVSIFMAYNIEAFNGTGLIPDLQNGGWKGIPEPDGIAPQRARAATGPGSGEVVDQLIANLTTMHTTNSFRTAAERVQLRDYLLANLSGYNVADVTVAELTAKHASIQQAKMTTYLGLSMAPTSVQMGEILTGDERTTFWGKVRAFASAFDFGTIAGICDFKNVFVKSAFGALGPDESKYLIWLTYVQFSGYESLAKPPQDAKMISEIYADTMNGNDARHVVGAMNVLRFLLGEAKLGNNPSRVSDSVYASLQQLCIYCKQVVSVDSDDVKVLLPTDTLPEKNSAVLDLFSGVVHELASGAGVLANAVQGSVILAFIFNVFGSGSAKYVVNGDNATAYFKAGNVVAIRQLVSSLGHATDDETVNAAIATWTSSQKAEEGKLAAKAPPGDAQNGASEVAGRFATVAALESLFPGGDTVVCADSVLIGIVKAAVVERGEGYDNPLKRITASGTRAHWYQLWKTNYVSDIKAGLTTALNFAHMIATSRMGAWIARAAKIRILDVYKDQLTEKVFKYLVAAYTDTTSTVTVEATGKVVGFEAAYGSSDQPPKWPFIIGRDGPDLVGRAGMLWDAYYLGASAALEKPDALTASKYEIGKDLTLFQAEKVSYALVPLFLDIAIDAIRGTLASPALNAWINGLGGTFTDFIKGFLTDLPTADLTSLMSAKTRGGMGVSMGSTSAGIGAAARTPAAQFANAGIVHDVASNNPTRLYVRELRVKMSSAIIAKCGSDTGELLVGYPMTGVSTNQRTESMTVALRVYLGAILKKPENVTIIPHVAFEGIVKHDEWFYAVPEPERGSSPASTNGIKFIEIPGDSFAGTLRTGYAYPGTYATRVSGTGKIEVKQENAGPLGHLDDPYYMECVNGLQVYKAAPMQTVSYSK